MLCVSIAEKGYDRVSELIKNTEMAEIRIEKTGLSPDEIKTIFSSHNNLIATCRPENLNDSERLQLLKSAIDGGASWIDIEIESESEYLKELRDYAKEKGCRVIISYHNYDHTPDNEDLNKIIIESINYKADLVKIATKVVALEDSARLLALYQYKVPMLAIGMGELGKITRIAAIELGAPFSFVSIDENTETAPGQLTEEQMKLILKGLKSK